MNVFKRMSDIVSANINDVLDKIEDPEKMINLMITHNPFASDKGM